MIAATHLAIYIIALKYMRIIVTTILFLIFVGAILGFGNLPPAKQKEYFTDLADVLTDNTFNHEIWASKQTRFTWRLRSLPNHVPWEDQLKQAPALSPSKDLGILMDPYDADKHNGKKIGNAPMGYFVSLTSLGAAFCQECSYNWAGKKIGFLDRSSELFAKAVVAGYRIPANMVSFHKIPMSRWLQIEDILQNDVDVIVAYVIPQSAMTTLLSLQDIAISGFKGMDIDRIRLFYPYVKMETVSLEEVFGMETGSSKRGMRVPASEKPTMCPAMTMPLLVLRGNMTEIREGFITRLDWSKETLDPSYRCYGKTNVASKAECESPNDVIGLPKEVQTYWDQPCVKNEDCPFYQKNTRYPNKRGGCLQDGVCEFPVGVKRIAYRKYDDRGIHAPFCYGCGTDPDCCEKNPDYAFSNDQEDRRKARAKNPDLNLPISIPLP